MKLKLKRSAGADSPLDHDAMAAEESRGPRGRGESRAERSTSPAAAGTLHRAYVGGYAPTPEFEDELDAKERAALRSRRGWLSSTLGRAIVGGVLCFCLGATAAVFFVMRNYLLHDERFIIPASANIEFDGNQHMTRAQLLSVFGSDVERSIFRVPLAERQADLERLPWVAHATVMRLMPNRIRVQLTERVPVAFVRQGTNIGLVDADGVLLDMPAEAAGDPRYSFPVLTGLSEDEPPATRAASMQVYSDFMKAIAGEGQQFADKVSEVDVSNPEDVKAMVAENGSDILVHFGDEEFLSRFQHFEQHLAEWQQQYPKLASADMRYERQVVLEMQPGAGIPLNAPADVPESSTTAPKAQAATPKTSSAAALAPVSGAKPADGKAVAAKPVVTKSTAANEKIFQALAAAHKTSTSAARKPPPAIGDAQ